GPAFSVRNERVAFEQAQAIQPMADETMTVLHASAASGPQLLEAQAAITAFLTTGTVPGIKQDELLAHLEASKAQRQQQGFPLRLGGLMEPQAGPPQKVVPLHRQVRRPYRAYSETESPSLAGKEHLRVD